MLTKAAKYQKSSTKHFYYVAWTYYEMSKKTTYYKLPFFASCLHKVGSELISQNNHGNPSFKMDFPDKQNSSKSSMLLEYENSY